MQSKRNIANGTLLEHANMMHRIEISRFFCNETDERTAEVIGNINLEDLSADEDHSRILLGFDDEKLSLIQGLPINNGPNNPNEPSTKLLVLSAASLFLSIAFYIVIMLYKSPSDMVCQGKMWAWSKKNSTWPDKPNRR